MVVPPAISLVLFVHGGFYFFQAFQAGVDVPMN